MRQLLLASVICVISVVASLLAFEYLLWAAEDKDGVQGSFNEALRLRSEGQQVVPLILPTMYIRRHPEAPFVPLAAPSQVEMIGVNENGFWPRFRTDEFGFNNSLGAHSKSPDILLVGDSFTQGITVRNTDNLQVSSPNRVGVW